MKVKYFLVNDFMPVMCNCPISKLRQVLLNKGFCIISLKSINEHDYLTAVSNLLNSGNCRSLISYF